MRVVIVTDFAEADSGGNRMFFQLAEISKKLFDTYLLTGRASPSPRVTTKCAWIYQDCPQPYKCPHKALLLFLCAAVNIARLKPDIIITNSHLPNLLAWIYPRKTVAVLHHIEQFQGVLRPLAELIQKAELKAPHRLIMTPVAKFTENTLLVPPLYEVPICPKAPKIPGLITMIGRLEKRKHYDLALIAFKIAKQQDSQLKLVVIGDGPEKQKITGLVEKLKLTDVVLKGRVTDEEKLKILAQSEIFLHTGYPEGYVISIQEAHNCQNKIVAYKETPSLRDINCDKYPYETFKPQEIASKILQARKSQIKKCKTIKSTKKIYEKILNLLAR